MPRLTLKLLVLSAVFAVAPATAGQRIGPAPDGHSAKAGCPHERARLAAAAHRAAPRKVEKVTLTVPARWRSSLFGWDGASRSVTP